MRRSEAEFATVAVSRTGARLGAVVRTARLARGWSQGELAERSRVSTPTIHRMERGAVQTGLGAWLSVFDALGLLGLFDRIQDPASDALLQETLAKRPLRAGSSDDLDF